MSRSELVRRLRQLEGGDPESDHMEADNLLLAYIGDLEVTRAFEAISKWYA